MLAAVINALVIRFAQGGLALVLVLAVGCAGAQPRVEAYDPLEGVNRSFHTFNTKFDEIVMQPVVDAYLDLTHENFRLSVSNFFDNLTYPNVIMNTLLQGKFVQGVSDTGRFLLNSTLGVGGIFDAATVFGLEEHDEDLGQTLAVWGLAEGPYLTLPFFGPSTVRDLPDLGGSILTNVFTYVGTPVLVAGVSATAPLALLGIIDKRARADRAIRARDQLALDSYVFTREAYRQHRTFLIYDGNPPVELYVNTDTLDEAILEIEEELAEEEIGPSNGGRESDEVESVDLLPVRGDRHIQPVQRRNGHGNGQSPNFFAPDAGREVHTQSPSFLPTTGN